MEEVGGRTGRTPALRRALHRDAEQRIKDLESELESTVSALEKSERESDDARTSVASLKEKLGETERSLCEARDALHLHRSEADALKMQRDSALLLRDTLSNMIEVRNGEIERSKIAMESLRSQMQKTMNDRCENILKTKIALGKAIDEHYREARTEREAADDACRIEMLEDELQRCMSNLQNVQSDYASLKIDYERQLARKSDELDVSNTKIAKLEEFKEVLYKKIDDLEGKLSDRTEKKNKIIEEYDSKLQAKTKIVELYKNAQEDSNVKNEELVKSVAELKRLLNESNENYEQMRVKLENSISEHKTIINEKDERITSLKRELENANELLQITDNENISTSMDELSPSAAIASQFIRSRMSITQAYDQIIQLTEELSVEKNENKRLSHALTSIIGELEEKAPFIEQLKRQNEDHLEMNSLLNQRIETLVADLNQLKSGNTENLKLSNRYQKENVQLKTEIEDLGRQICFLLKEAEIRKGKYRSYEDINGSSFNLSYEMNSSNTITENLVTFSDITELQSNNKKLLKLIRDLTDKKEECEQKENRNDNDDVESKLEVLKKRITELTEAQDRQVKMINDLIRQRDTYKKRCTDYNQSISSNLEKCNDSLDLNKSDMGSNFYCVELLESQLASVKKELEHERVKHRAFMEKAKVNELELVKMHDSSLKQYMELNSKFGKCLSTCEGLTEKCKVLEMNLSTAKRENMSLNEKITSYIHLTGKQESSIKKIHDELSTSRNKLVHAESLINTLQIEHTNLLNTTKQSANDTITDNQIKQDYSCALKNIESIKSTIQNNDNDSYVKLQSMLEEANRTYSILRCMLQLEQTKYCDLTSYLKDEMEQYKHKICSEQDAIEKLKIELSETKRELHIKSALVRELNSKLSFSDGNSETREITTNPISFDLGQHDKISEQSDDIHILKQQLEISRQHIEKYCNIYENSEKDLKAVNESYNNYKQQVESQLKSTKENEECLRNTCSDLESKLTAVTEEILSTKDKINSLSTELTDKSVLLNKALSDVASLSETLQAADDKYANEIILHSSDIEALTQVKQELLQAKEQYCEIERVKIELENILKDNQESWRNQEKILTQENQELIVQLQDLNNQNTILHNQIQNLSMKVTAYGTNKVGDNSIEASLDNSLSYSFDDMELKSSEQLLQIIKYLRKEKDILVTKFDIMQAENIRIKSQLENAETQLDDAKLTSENTNKVDVLSSIHSGVIRKVETLNAMSDCFVDLRKERDNLHMKVQEISSKYNDLSDNVILLRENNNELLAKINMLQAENNHFKTEINKWKTMANSLIEKGDSVDIDDFKKLQNEREALSRTLIVEKENVKKLSDDISKLRSDKTLFENQVDELNKNLSSLNENMKKKTLELTTLKKDFELTSKELTDMRIIITEKIKEVEETNTKLSTKDSIIEDIRNKEAQVRKIGKRYKTQYEELLKTIEEEKKKSAALVTEAAATSENHLETCKVLEQKTIDLEKNHEEELNTLKTQISSCSDENKNLRKELDTLKSTNINIEEKARLLLKQAKTKLFIITEAKEALAKELNETKAKLDLLEQNKDENDVRLSLLKSQYDGRMAKLEKEKSNAIQEKQTEIAQLNKLMESLLQKINSQTSKPSMSNSQSEKCNTEPPTANIKPMAGVSQRDNNRRVSGETPLASIRPMASHSGVRTAAVLPTTAQLSTHPIIQAPHTTGNVTSDILSSSSSSLGTEYMPSSSSPSARLHSQHSRHISLPPAESTQDVETEVTVSGDAPSASANLPNVQQSLGAPQVGLQAVALVMPRMETSTTDAQPLHTHQQQASSSSSSNSNLNSTVTTSHGPIGDNNGLGNKTELHRAFKRPRIASAHPQQKTILKRPKIQGFQRVTENDAEYQMPTSSQRDQEDDMVNFADSEDEENYQDPVYGIEDEENDVDDKERPVVETRNATDSNVSEEQEATGSNNEADIIDDSSQEIRSSHREESGIRRCDENRSNDHAASAALVIPMQEQQIETISSGTVGGTYEDGDDGVVPSTPTLYVPKRNDGESGSSNTISNIEDTHSDLTPQLSPREHAIAGTSVSANINVNAQSSEAEAGGNLSSGNNNTIDDESPTVSSQSTSSSFVSQMDDNREAEASSTGNNIINRGSWRGARGMINRRGSMSQIHNQRTPDQRPSPIVWNSDGNNRRGSFVPQRGLIRIGRHLNRRPQTFYKRF